MNDRRLLRRYLALVRHADELFDECQTADAVLPPAPAEAAALLDELSLALAPALSQFPDTSVDPEEIRRHLAGWVH